MTYQSRAMSLVEACTNIAVGFVINVTGQLIIYPLFGFHPPFAANLGIAVCFTGLSLARSYLLRRTFNTLHLWGIA